MRGAVLISGLAIVASGAVQAETITVSAKNLGFVPPAIAAKVGDTVRWVNEDILLHSATTALWTLALPPNGTASRTMTRAGTIEYRCRYHPGMTGTIMVRAR